MSRLTCMAPNSATPSRFRFIRAYQVTLRILVTYLFLLALRKIMGTNFTERLIQRTHQKTAKKITKNLFALQGLYIKIGQTLSIMTNFLPPAFTQELEQLQDSVPPHSYDDIKKRFLEDFKKEPTQLFTHFNKIPLASASLAQVHQAELKDGSKLAVKLQYPHIERLVISDLKTIKKIFSLLHFFFPYYGLKNVFKECEAMILQELDFEQEGKNLEIIRDHFKEEPRYVFPKIYWDYSSKKILTAEYIDGVKVTNIEALKKQQIDPHEVAISLIHAYCKQIFIDGVYHADPHPGNIIIIPEQSSPSPQSPPTRGGDEISNFKIALVDYGATATISSEMKAGITQFVEGLIKKDTRLLSQALKQMGFIAKQNQDNEEVLDKIVNYFYGRIKGIKIDNFKNLNLTDFQNLNDLIEIKKMDVSLRELSQTFHIPKDWVLLERTLILMMGLVTHLDPYLNPVDIVLPYVEKFVLGKDKKLSDILLQSSKELITSYLTLPHEIQNFLRKLKEGKISLSSKDENKRTEKLYRGMHQLIYTILLTLSVTLTYLFYKDGNFDLMEKTKYASYALGGLLGISLIKNKLR